VRARHRHLDPKPGKRDCLGSLALQLHRDLAVAYWSQSECALSPRGERGQSCQSIEDGREFEDG
jgi:hypothetical protein